MTEWARSFLGGQLHYKRRFFSPDVAIKWRLEPGYSVVEFSHFNFISQGFLGFKVESNEQLLQTCGSSIVRERCKTWRRNLSAVETCISFMGIYLIRMVRSVETKQMRGTKEKNRMMGRIQIRILSQPSKKILRMLSRLPPFFLLTLSYVLLKRGRLRCGGGYWKGPVAPWRESRLE